MAELILNTSRLRLAAATLATYQVELHDRQKLAEMLQAEVPPGWPPPLNDADSMHYFIDYIADHPDATGWTMWYFILRGGKGNRDQLIGNGGFKGLPGEDGTAEIGYSVMETHHGQGYAPEAVAALLAWAFSHGEVRRITAETFPHLRPSIRVLEKNGFRYLGPAAEAPVIRFEITRDDYVKRIKDKRGGVKKRREPSEDNSRLRRGEDFF